MTLIRIILMTTALNNISISFQFIPGYVNQAADALSRLQLERFHRLVPTANGHATIPPATVWDWQKSAL